MLTHRAARLATTVLAVCLRACSGPTQAAALNPPCQLSVPCPVAGQQCVDNAFLNRRVCSCPTGSGYLAGENCRASCPIVDTSKFQGSLPRPRDAADCATRPSAAWPCSRSPPRPSMNLASLLLLSSDPTLWATSFGLTRSRLRRGAGAQACSATPRAIIQRASANCTGICPTGCSGHGRCVLGADQKGTCVCDVGYRSGDHATSPLTASSC